MGSIRNSSILRRPTEKALRPLAGHAEAPASDKQRECLLTARRNLRVAQPAARHRLRALRAAPTGLTLPTERKVHMTEFEFAALLGAPAVTVDEVSLSKTYAASVRRVFRTATDRCWSSNREPTMRDVHIQLAIRAAVLETPTGVRELSAMRGLIKTVRKLQAAYDEAGYIMMPFQLVPENVELPFWFRFEEWSSFDRFAEGVMLPTYKQIRARGRCELRSMVKYAVESGQYPDKPKNESVIAESLAGRIAKSARRSPKIGWVPISEREFERILDQLPAGTERAALDSLREGKRMKAGGIARLLARSIWLTGMRALEVFQCRLLTTDPDEKLPPPELRKILDDPREAHEAGRLRGADLEIARNDFRHDGRKPLIFGIKTLKTANSSPLINNAFRFQLLGGINQRGIAALAFASMLSRLQIPRSRAAGIAGRCTNHLGLASLKADPGREHSVTLHTLRHAFIDAARGILLPHEVAALSGHTARDTMLGYGGKYVRRRKKSGRTRWMPTADPASAEAIRKAWSLRMALKAKPTPDPELIPEPHFH